MRAKGFSALVAGCLLLACTPALRAQTLADIAKKEEERRKQTPASGKVYTNKDLGAVPPSTAPSPASSGSTQADADTASEKPASGEKGDKAAADKDKDKDKEKGPAKDQKYWRERMKAAQDAVDRDSTLADAMQSRINALTTDFVNRDDPAQRSVIESNRRKALTELERLKKQLADDKKAIADLEEEARRAGVPPGWLR